MNIAASIISLLMTLLPFVLRLLLYINCIIPTKARNGCRLAPECVCVCVCVREREREQLSHPATSIHPCVGGMRLNPTFAPSIRIIYFLQFFLQLSVNRSFDSFQCIEIRLKVSLPDDLSSALQDGVVLCHLANHVRPRSVASIHVPSPAVPKLTVAKCRRNVENFIEACRRIGVPEVSRNIF